MGRNGKSVKVNKWNGFFKKWMKNCAVNSEKKRSDKYTSVYLQEIS